MKTAHIDFADYLPDIVLPDGITLLGWRMVIDESDGDKYDVDGTVACIVGDEPFKVVTAFTETESVPITAAIIDRLGVFIGDDQCNIVANHVVFVSAYDYISCRIVDLWSEEKDAHNCAHQEIIEGMVLKHEPKDIDWLSMDGIGVVLNFDPDEEFVEIDGELYNTFAIWEDLPEHIRDSSFYSKDPTHFEFRGKVYKYPEQ